MRERSSPTRSSRSGSAYHWLSEDDQYTRPRDYGEPATRDELPLLDGAARRRARVATAAGHGIEILGPPVVLPAELPARAA